MRTLEPIMLCTRDGYPGCWDKVDGTLGLKAARECGEKGIWTWGVLPWWDMGLWAFACVLDGDVEGFFEGCYALC